MPSSEASSAERPTRRAGSLMLERVYGLASVGVHIDGRWSSARYWASASKSWPRSSLQVMRRVRLAEGLTDVDAASNATSFSAAGARSATALAGTLNVRQSALARNHKSRAAL